ncbi:MAG: 6-phosphogluconolactonase [Candidatus Omnitrophota bacterium]
MEDLGVVGNRKKIYAFDGPEDAAGAASREWNRLTQKAIEARGRSVIAVSGGRSPVGLFKKLSNYKEGMRWKKTHIFLVDERFAPLDDSASNYRMIKENLLDMVDIPKTNIHPVQIEESVEISANAYEKEIANFFDLKKNEIPRFDMILLGLGEDGHIASLFPGDNAVSERKSLAIPITLDRLQHSRVTLTLPVINNARKIIFFITGEKKAFAVKGLLEDDGKMPAQLVKPVNGEMLFFLDALASSLLSK